MILYVSLKGSEDDAFASQLQKPHTSCVDVGMFMGQQGIEPTKIEYLWQTYCLKLELTEDEAFTMKMRFPVVDETVAEPQQSGILGSYINGAAISASTITANSITVSQIQNVASSWAQTLKDSMK